jgi:hypothetical protein
VTTYDDAMKPHPGNVSHLPIEKPNGIRVVKHDQGHVDVHDSDVWRVVLRDWDAEPNVYCAIAFDRMSLRKARMGGDEAYLEFVFNEVAGALQSLAERRSGRPSIGAHVEFDGHGGWIVHAYKRVGMGLYIVSAHKGDEEIVDVPWERFRYA